VAKYCSECGNALHGSHSGSTSRSKVAPKATKSKRAPSAYAQRYGRAFKRLSKKYKLKSGGWKKDGFKRCQKAAHRAVKK